MHTLVTFTPLGRVSFRWFGTSSPLARGPMTAMVSEPVPLPTTVAGALYTALGGERVEGGVDLSRLSELLREKIGCGGGVFRGPYVLIHRPHRPGEWVAACLHALGKGLFCVGVRGEVFMIGPDEASISFVGISLDNRSKTVIEGMMYSQTTVDYRAIALAASEKLGKAPLEASLAIEFPGCSVPEPVRRAVPLGGEGRIARVRVSTGSEPSPLDCVAEKGKECGRVINYFATPCIMRDKEILSNAIDPAKLLEGVTRELGLGPGEVLARETSVIVGVAPTGYDTASNRPRPLRPAVMPGSVITASRPISRGPGPLGYCTIIPAPTPPFLKR